MRFSKVQLYVFAFGPFLFYFSFLLSQFLRWFLLDYQLFPNFHSLVGADHASMLISSAKLASSPCSSLDYFSLSLVFSFQFAHLSFSSSSRSFCHSLFMNHKLSAVSCSRVGESSAGFWISPFHILSAAIFVSSPHLNHRLPEHFPAFFPSHGT